MQVTITTRHVEVPPQAEELIRSKLSKLERYGQDINGIHATFGQEHYLHTAEIEVTGKGLHLVAKAKDDKDILTVAEEAMAKMKEQLRRHEEKQIQVERRKARQNRMPDEAIFESEEDE